MLSYGARLVKRQPFPFQSLPKKGFEDLAPRGASNQIPVDIKRGHVFTHWFLVEVKDQEAAGGLPRLCMEPGNSAERF